jgi:hypothetical protein
MNTRKGAQTSAPEQSRSFERALGIRTDLCAGKSHDICWAEYVANRRSCEETYPRDPRIVQCIRYAQKLYDDCLLEPS